MRHATEGLARPCTAWDLFLVSGGVQCGNCLATSTPPRERRNPCRVPATDGPCPLEADGDGGACWVHRAASAPPLGAGREPAT